MAAKSAKMKTERAKRAEPLFLLLNIQICNVFLNLKIWIKQPYIR